MKQYLSVLYKSMLYCADGLTKIRLLLYIPAHQHGVYKCNEKKTHKITASQTGLETLNIASLYPSSQKITRRRA